MGCLDRDEVLFCLRAAELLIEQGHAFHGERIYKDVLRQTELVEDDGPLTGLVLLHLHDLYCERGRNNEAAPVRERIRRILIREFEYCKAPKIIEE